MLDFLFLVLNKDSNFLITKMLSLVSLHTAQGGTYKALEASLCIVAEGDPDLKPLAPTPTMICFLGSDPQDQRVGFLGTRTISSCLQMITT